MFKSFIEMLCKSNDTSLGSLQNFEEATGEFKEALASKPCSKQFSFSIYFFQIVGISINLNLKQKLHSSE